MTLFPNLPSLLGHRTRPRPVIAIGSSQTELFDYIFGDNPDYHPLWAGGWSARGLRREEKGGYLDKITRHLPKRSTVFLVFGSVDANFVFRHQRRARPWIGEEDIIAPAVDGLRHARRFLRKKGLRHVHAVFASPVPKLPREYWDRFSDVPQLEDNEMGRIYYGLAKRTATRMPVIDVLDELCDIAKGDYSLRPEFAREKHDHHPDYVNVQDIVWDRIKMLPGILPRRDPPHTVLYPHVPAGIGKLKEAGQVRPRTCR
jgi:hypothetical protein